MAPPVQGFVPARPQDQGFVPARPEDQGFIPARPEDIGAQQPQSSPLTANPKNEGLYQMIGPSGPAAIPFSNVETARQQGFQFRGGSVLTPGATDEQARYTKDKTYSSAIDRTLGTPSAGAVKSAVQVPNAIAGWLDSMATSLKEKSETAHPERHYDYQPGSAKQGLESAEEKVAPGVTEPLHGVGEHLGGLAETMAEWLYGEGEAKVAFQALPMSQRTAKIAQTMGFLEKNPALAEAVSEGLKQKALRIAAKSTAIGAGGGVQALAHGKTLGEAGEAALTTGLLGGAGEVLAGKVQGAASKVAKIKSAITTSEGTPGRFAAGATDTLNRALDRLGLVTDKAAPPVPATDYGEAAAKLGERASSLYDEADSATNGQWRGANAEYQAAKASGDKGDIAAARKKLDDLAVGSGDANYDQALQQATDRARDAFHDHYTLDAIHNKLVKAFDFGTPETAAMKGSANTFDGAELSKQLRNLELDPDVGRERMVELMGEDGYKALHDLSDVAKSPVQNQSAKQIIKEIAVRAHQTGSKAAWAGGMLGHFLPSGWAATAAAGYGAGTLLGGGEVASDKLLGYIATKPRLTKLLTYAAKKQISPQYGAALLGTAINQELQKDADQSQQEQPDATGR